MDKSLSLDLLVNIRSLFLSAQFLLIQVSTLMEEILWLLLDKTSLKVWLMEVLYQLLYQMVLLALSYLLLQTKCNALFKLSALVQKDKLLVSRLPLMEKLILQNKFQYLLPQLLWHNCLLLHIHQFCRLLWLLRCLPDIRDLMTEVTSQYSLFLNQILSPPLTLM